MSNVSLSVANARFAKPRAQAITVVPNPTRK